MRLAWLYCPRCRSELSQPIALFSADQSQITGVQYSCSCGWAVVELPRTIDIIGYHRFKQEQYD